MSKEGVRRLLVVWDEADGAADLYDRCAQFLPQANCLAAPTGEQPVNKVIQRERRYKLVAVNHNWVLDVLRAWNGERHCLQLPVIRGIPDDVVIEAVYEDWYRKQFVLRLWHSSFDIVPDGALIPFLQETTQPCDLVELRRVDDTTLPAFILPSR